MFVMLCRFKVLNRSFCFLTFCVYFFVEPFLLNKEQLCLNG
jgi:hypothetical protein